MIPSTWGTIKNTWYNLRRNLGFETAAFMLTIGIAGIILCVAGIALSFIWHLSFRSSDPREIAIVVTSIGIGLPFILTGINAILKPPKEKISYYILLIVGFMMSILAIAIFPLLYVKGWYIYPQLYGVCIPYLGGIFLLVISTFFNVGAKVTEITSLGERLEEAVANADAKETEMVSLRINLEEAREIIKEKEEIDKEEAIPDYIGGFADEIKKNVDEFTKGLNERTQSAIQKYQSSYEQLRIEIKNYEQKLKDEMREFKERANVEILKELLDTITNLDHVLNTIKQRGDGEDVLFKGIKGTQEQLYKVLKSQGVETIEVSVGDGYDPEKHEVVGKIETNEYPDKTVVDVVREGCKFEKFEKVEKAKVVVSVPKKEETAKIFEESK